LNASDEVSGAAKVAVISASLWTSRFGRSADILGRVVQVAGEPHEIVGVMPQGFSSPRDEVIWLALRHEDTARELQVLGRLADGVSLESAQAEIRAVALRAEGAGAGAEGLIRPEIITTAVLRAEVPANGENDPLVFVAQILALGLLLIVCGNVGIMILARTSSRSGEIAVRGALGASRGTIVGQLFVEGLVLALLATGFGLGVASWGVQRLQALAGPELTMVDFSIGWRTVALALCLSVVCAGVASVVPALRATRGGVQERLLRFAGRGSAMRFGAGSTALIVVELAMSVALLSYGVVWARTVLQDTSGEMGIELDRYLSAQVLVSDPEYGVDVAAYPEALLSRLASLQAELKRRLETESAVRAVAVADAGDLPGSRNAPLRVLVEGSDFPQETPAVVASSKVDVDFFRALDQPILQGRDFTPADLPQELRRHRTPVIVNTRFVEQVLGGRNPLGRRIRYASDAENWYEVVGVVGSLGLNPVNPDLDAGVYHPVAPGEVNAVGFVIDVRDNPMGFVPRLREIAAEVDPAAMVRQPMLLSDLAAREWTGLRYLALAPVLFSLASILLSAAGLYAIMTFSISQRTRELGIRAALGASRSSIIASIGRKAALQLALGVVLGCVLAVPVMIEVSDDPLVKPQNWLLVVAGVIAGLTITCLAACFAPALRAVRIQPTEALREE
jgi:predicted permease